jgi:hypothetical protein
MERSDTPSVGRYAKVRCADRRSAAPFLLKDMQRGAAGPAGRVLAQNNPRLYSCIAAERQFPCMDQQLK